MTDKEILAAMKEMFAEERKITDAKLDAAQKATDAKFGAAQKATDAKIDAAQRAIDAKFDAAQRATDAKFDAAQRATTAAIKAAQQETIKETIRQIKMLLENGVEKQIKLLAEGHAQILARLPDVQEQEKIKSRVATLEHVTAEHTRQINELKRA